MTTIIFESHATTFDNEQKIASGHYDVDLSPTGIERAKELGVRRSDEHFDAIFCSDLQRSYKTAILAFGNKFPIFVDSRLRECDYGEYQHKSSSFIEAARIKHIIEPFPGGESYRQRAELMRTFLAEILRDHPQERILVIGHRATQYGIERWTTGKPLLEIASEPWKWQPGWVYKLQSVQVL